MRLYMKFILLIGAVALGFGLISSVTESRMMDKVLDRNLRNDAVLAAQTLAEHITHNVIDVEVVAAHDAAMKIRDRLETIEYVYIVDFDGKVFTHTFEGGFPKVFAFRMKDRVPVLATEPEIIEYVSDTGRILDIAVPLIEGMKARIHIGMSKAHSQAQIAAIRNRIIGLSLVLAIIGIAIGAIVSRRLTRRLMQMAASMRDFGKRRGKEEIDFTGGGREIRELTDAFNRMISNRKQAEQALRQSEDKYRTLVSHTPAVLWTSDQNGHTSFISSNVKQVYGYTQEEILKAGDSLWFGRIHPEDIESVKGAYEVMMKRGDPFDIEYRIQRQDGHWIWLHDTATRSHEIDGVLRIDGVFMDITERKQAEQQREKLLKTVEAQNQQLTASEQQLRASSQQTNALNQQLIASQQELSLKNEELQSIVYISSHDLKTPLVNINGFSEILKEHCGEMKQLLKKCDTDTDTKREITSLLNDDIPTDLDYISTSTKRMQRLIEGLLQVSRIGTIEFKTQKIDMNNIVAEIIDNVKYKTEELDAEIVFENLPDCTGDKDQITQVFTNLIDNALKYLSPKRKGRIKITGKTKNKENIYCIEDNGIGINPAYYGKVFEIYHRLKPQTSTEGDGLGLTIVRRILDRHKGRIWLESEPKKGSKFFIALPTK